jgi:ABC-type transport system substrate-binding protein
LGANRLIAQSSQNDPERPSSLRVTVCIARGSLPFISVVARRRAEMDFLLEWLAVLLVVAMFPAQAADPAKVLRVAFEQDPTGFDPQVASDGYSGSICRAIFDSLLEYDYLKRPYALKPSTAQSLPDIRDGGRTFVFKIKPGIYFTPDPAFNGKPRELIADDYVYSWKRLIDPRMRSFWSFYLDGKLVEADELVAAAQGNGKFDYDFKLEGLQALDRYTLQVKLKEPDYLLLERMTTVVTAAVAREIVEAYGTPVHVGGERIGDRAGDCW